MKKPWYILEYEEKEYLHSKKLEFKEVDYILPDHQHCELCWATFSQCSGDLHSGYYEVDSESWICKECYDSFKELFKWTTEEQSTYGVIK